METKNIKSWFESEVMWPRTTSSLIRAVFLQFLTLFVFISLQSFNPLHPLTWVSTSIGLLITPSSWFYDLIAVVTVTGIGLFYSTQVSLFPWIPKNPVANFTRCFLPQVLTSFAAHFVAGGVLMRSYLGLLDGKFNSLTVISDGEKGLNAPHVWLVMSGCFTAVTMWKGFHFSNENLVQFPMIPQTGNAQLSRQVQPLIKTSFNNVVSNFKWFLLLYIIIGHRFINILSDISKLKPHYLITWNYVMVWNFVELTLQYLVLNSLLTFSLRLLRSIICINFTKRFNFDVTGNFSMIKAMSEEGHDLMTYSSFYEFSLVSSESKSKRSEFFTLSQPGGHPHNWNSLSNACLTKIENFVKKLNDSVAPPAPPAAKTNDPTPIPHSTLQSPKSPRPLVPPPATSDKISDNNNKIQTVKTIGAKERIEEILSKSALASYPVKVLKAVRDRFSNNALFSATPDAGTRSVFAESQIIIWAVEGLSYLISSSMQEDRYGVVQKDLPRVISCLFVLQKTVDKHKGVTISSKRNRLETRDLQLKQELRASLKSSIYRIISTYGDHLDSLPLPSEHQKKINNYKHFQE